LGIPGFLSMFLGTATAFGGTILPGTAGGNNMTNKNRQGGGSSTNA
jgi:hypothetical protein